jgi:hypothetical protein
MDEALRRDVPLTRSSVGIKAFLVPMKILSPHRGIEMERSIKCTNRVNKTSVS